MLAAQQGGHGVAPHQGDNVTAHAVVPGAAVRVELGRVCGGVAALAQAVGHCGEGREVEFRQAGHGTAEVNSFHGESLPDNARLWSWGVMRRVLGVAQCAKGRWRVPALPLAAG